MSFGGGLSCPAATRLPLTRTITLEDGWTWGILTSPLVNKVPWGCDGEHTTGYVQVRISKGLFCHYTLLKSTLNTRNGALAVQSLVMASRVLVEHLVIQIRGKGRGAAESGSRKCRTPLNDGWWWYCFSWTAWPSSGGWSCVCPQEVMVRKNTTDKGELCGTHQNTGKSVQVGRYTRECVWVSWGGGRKDNIVEELWKWKSCLMLWYW